MYCTVMWSRWSALNAMLVQELLVIGYKCKVKACDEFLDIFKTKVLLLHNVEPWASDINVKFY